MWPEDHEKWPTEAGTLWVPNPDDAVKAVDQEVDTIIFKRGFESGYTKGYDDSVQDNSPIAITDESREQAAQFLFRKDAPMGEPHDAWRRSSAARKQIYFNSSEMIARLYLGWPI